ncbi:hypothetical protein F0726_00402 [Acidithiobacillus caldus]|nr:hypothetical protein F0726_00402 [Acidithiobacillus caldus]
MSIILLKRVTAPSILKSSGIGPHATHIHLSFGDTSIALQ